MGSVRVNSFNKLSTLKLSEGTRLKDMEARTPWHEVIRYSIKMHLGVIQIHYYAFERVWGVGDAGACVRYLKSFCKILPKKV